MLPTVKLSVIVLLSITILLNANVSSGQQSKRKPGRNKNRSGNRKKSKEDTSGIYCYTCYADFERVPYSVFNPVNYIFNNLCYNPALNYTLTDNEYLTKCSRSVKFCTVDVTRMNNVLLSVDRRCGTSTCRHTCLSRGYGVIRETCTFCCGGRVNEDNPDYDEDLHSSYHCPNEPH